MDIIVTKIEVVKTKGWNIPALARDVKHEINTPNEKKLEKLKELYMTKNGTVLNSKLKYDDTYSIKIWYLLRHRSRIMNQLIQEINQDLDCQHVKNI